VIGDVIEHTFISKETGIVTVEVAQIVGLIFDPEKKDWEYVPHWLWSDDPEDDRPLFNSSDSVDCEDHEGLREIIRVRKIT
jgi:hypothetical protein